jgi:DNA-binding NarL/FixJ family response regulator
MLADFFREFPEIHLIGEAADADTLLELLKQNNIGVILLEYKLPGMHLNELIDCIRGVDQACRVLVMSADPENARLALNAGANTFISKGEHPEWLLEMVRRVEQS